MVLCEKSILVWSSLAQCAIYYNYDIPGALNFSLDPNEMPSIETQIAILYSSYSIPNIILPYCFSYALKFSKYKLILILSICFLLGQSIFTLGIYNASFRSMVLGRILMGIGGESFSLIQNKIIGDSIKQESNQVLFAFFNSAGQLGPVLNYFITPLICKIFGTLVAVLTGTAFLFITLIFCALIYKNLAKIQKYKSCLYTLEFINYSESRMLETNQNRDTKLVEARRSLDNIGKLKHLSMHFKDLSSLSQKKEKRPFSLNFVILAALCFVLSLVFYPFCNIAPMMFQRNYNLEANFSSMLVGLIDAISLIFSFLISHLTNKLGQKLNLSIFGTFCVMIAHTALLLGQRANPILPILILGTSIPFSSCFWYFLPNLVPEDSHQHGFGILFCISNLAYSISPPVVALFTAKNSYFWVEIYFLSCLLIGLLLLFILLKRNKKFQLALNRVF